MPRTDLVDVRAGGISGTLKAVATFQGTSSLRAWLSGIARHKVDDLYRQRLRTPEPLPDGDNGAEHASDEPSIDDVLDATRVRARARALLATEKSVERMLARARARVKELWLQG